MFSSKPNCSSQNKLPRSSWRYLMVGVLLFVIDYAVTRIIYVEMQQSLVVAQWAGRLIGAGVGYWLHGAYTFAVANQRVSAARIRYCVVAAGLWLISPLLLKMAMIAAPASLLLGKIFTEGILVGASYLLLRYFVFTSPGKS